MTKRPARKLVVMMPALNEAKTIGNVIDGIPREIAGVSEVGVVVVDDGSTDGTGDIARQRGAIVVRHPQRMGLGQSFADALDRSLREGADIIVNIDADGQFDPAQIPELVGPILRDEADFVTASRFARKDLIPKMPWIKRWGNRQMCRLVNLATGTTQLSDVSCGFRAFSRPAALHLNLVGAFTYTHESIIDLAGKGYRVAEVPLKVRGVREHGESRMARNPFLYGVRAFMIVLRAMCYTRPLAFFGGTAAVLFGLGMLQGLFVFGHWLNTGRTAPYRSVLIGSSLFLILAFLTGILALLSDMLGRLGNVAEELYLQMKRERYAAPTGGDNTADEGEAGESPSA